MRLLLILSVTILCIFDASAQRFRNPLKIIQNGLKVRKGIRLAYKSGKQLFEKEAPKTQLKQHHRSAITIEKRMAYGAESANQLLRMKSESVDLTALLALCFLL